MVLHRLSWKLLPHWNKKKIENGVKEPNWVTLVSLFKSYGISLAFHSRNDKRNNTVSPRSDSSFNKQRAMIPRAKTPHQCREKLHVVNEQQRRNMLGSLVRTHLFTRKLPHYWPSCHYTKGSEWFSIHIFPRFSSFYEILLNAFTLITK